MIVEQPPVGGEVGALGLDEEADRVA